MVMPVPLRRFTTDEVDAFPADGNRYELLDGVVFVTPAPGMLHQRVASRLMTMLAGFIDSRPPIEVFGPGVVPIDSTSRLEPDILVAEPAPPADDWAACRSRLLAVEISGSGSRLVDQTYKRDAYLAAGVREVWLVDLERRHIIVARPGRPDETRPDRLEWRLDAAGPTLSIAIPELFLPRS
ncbi:MAG: Uma2 family endonuclease [Gemmatimonadales bacterium]